MLPVTAGTAGFCIPPFIPVIEPFTGNLMLRKQSPIADHGIPASFVPPAKDFPQNTTTPFQPNPSQMSIGARGFADFATPRELQFGHRSNLHRW
jgi:hypothetical protein